MTKLRQSISSSIQWHDGMILGPQHFQEAFFRTEDILHFYTREFIPYAYGLTLLKVDEGAFASGVFRILEAQGIFPDGLDFCYDAQKDKILAIELSEFEAVLSKKVMTVYIAVPLEGTSHNISMDELSRYKESRAESAYDQNVGGEELEIPRIRPRLKIMISELPPPHHASMPLAKLYMEGTLFRMKSYVAPLIKLTKSSVLWDECMQISIKFRQKIQMVLEDLQRMKTLNQQQYRFDKYVTIHALAMALPRFEALFKSEQAHPFMVHLELLSLLGGVYTIDQDTAPPVSREYNHNEILEGFLGIKQTVFDILDREIPSNFKIIPFTRVGNDFKIVLNESILKGGDIVFGFKKPFNVEANDFSEWIKTVIMGDSKKFEMLRQKRLLGFKRVIAEKYDDLIPQRNMFLVVATNTEEDIKEAESITISPSVQQNFKFSPDEVIFYLKVKA